MLRINRHVLLASAVALPLLVTAVGFAGCGSEGASSAGPVPTVAESTTTGATDTTRATTTMAATTSEAAETTPEAELADGRHFGYIKSVDLAPSPATLTFDLAYLLTGDEANAEAAKRGYPTPVDNDYFIVNDNPKLRTLPLAEDVELRLLDWGQCCDTFFSGDLRRFAASFDRKKYPAGNYKGTFSAYELTVRDGLVVAVDEHFFP